MKKSVFSVLSLLTLAALTIFTSACGSDDKGDKKDQNDSTKIELAPSDTSLIEHEGFESSINIRYIDMDSILANYNYAVQEMNKLQKKAKEIEQFQNSQSQQIQKLQNDIVQKQQNNGYLSQESYEKDMQNYYTKAQAAESQLAQRAQAFDAEGAKVQQTILTAINNYIIKYNEDKKYDAILLKAAGVYFNPSLDITKEILDGLNGSAANDDSAKEETKAETSATK